MIAPGRVDRAKVRHDPNKPLKWKHFKGSVPKKATMSAGTYSAWSPTWANGAITYIWDKVPGQGFTATATVNPAHLDIKAYVDTKKSWVKADDKTPELLGHERGHFAITHVIGEKTEQAAKKAAGSSTKEATSRQAAIKAAMSAVQGPVFAAYATGWKVARLAQCRYDGTSPTGTDHGRRPKQQADWAAAITADLPKYPVPLPGVDAQLSAEGC
jgi:hypothetical protein